jgi:phosphonatase-like hydrolase
MSIKLVVLDMAGTTVADDNAVSKAFINAFGKNGITISEQDVNPLMGYKKTMAIQIVLEKLGIESDEELIEKIHDDFTEEMINYYESSPEVKPVPYTEEMLMSLKEKGVRIALNTGFPRSVALAIMDRFQWGEKGLVDDFIASDEVERGRPDPFMIRQLMYSAGIDDPAEVAKIGDTEVDINEGRNAGCGLVVAVTTGAYTREQLQDYRPDYIIDSLTELPSLIS